MANDYHPELNPEGYDGIELDAKMEEVDAMTNKPDSALIQEKLSKEDE